MADQMKKKREEVAASVLAEAKKKTGMHPDTVGPPPYDTHWSKLWGRSWGLPREFEGAGGYKYRAVPLNPNSDHRLDEIRFEILEGPKGKGSTVHPAGPAWRSIRDEYLKDFTDWRDSDEAREERDKPSAKKKGKIE